MNNRLKIGLKIIVAGMIATQVVPTAMPMIAYANTTDFTYRKKVVALAGVINNTSSATELDSITTRAEFAKMLVKASSYKDLSASAVGTSVFSDVPTDSEYASYIKIATDNGWMSTYLGGSFKPDQPVTLKEAAKGVLGLLGYTTSDFTGDISASRLQKFNALELNREIGCTGDELLTNRNCINLFYNLFTTSTKSGKIYGTQIGLTVNSDGEVNPMELADSSLVGPKVAKYTRDLGSYFPFNIREASIFINGDPSTYDTLKSLSQNEYLVLYYNTSAKTVWAYEVNEEVDSGRCAVLGVVSNIYYSSSDVMTPSAVLLDGDDRSFLLSSTEMQFAFSVYGNVRVGDEVVLICEKSGLRTSYTDDDDSSDENATYTVIDVIEN